MQGAGIVFLGNFAGMVAGLALSPPQEINVPKIIGSSLFGGFIGIAIGEADTLRVYRIYFNFENNYGV